MPPHKKQSNEKKSGRTKIFCSALFPTFISTAFQAHFQGAKTEQFLHKSFLRFCTKNTKNFNICKQLIPKGCFLHTLKKSYIFTEKYSYKTLINYLLKFTIEVFGKTLIRT